LLEIMSLFWALSFTALLSFSFVSCDTNVQETQTFIVRVENDLKPSAFSDVEDWYSSTIESFGSNSHSSSILHVYKTVFHGFSAKITPQQALELEKRQEILGVFPDRIRKIQTTRSPEFLGLDSSTPNGLLKESDAGSNVVIGFLDTGIWPERNSFHDQDLGPIPSKWKGECVQGERFPTTTCNKKIIGARYFTDGYDAMIKTNNLGLKSARDTIGHGTHTASTAAGRAVSNASFIGFAGGHAVGIAPKARIAIYKVCWEGGCMESDILAGLDKALEDGVDVLSISLGSDHATPYYMDMVAIASFGAMEKGVFISAAAGNSGSLEGTVTNIAPWITTVGASTIDRKFPADLLLQDGTVIKGSSLYNGKSFKAYVPLIYGGKSSMQTNGTSFGGSVCLPDALDKELVRGKIVVCDRGLISRTAKGIAVRDAGGVGVVVANVAPSGEGLTADAHLIPGLAITESGRGKLLDYISSSPNPQATIVFHGTQMGVQPAPIVASFSSRGPNLETPYVMKPDVIAPGVDILAAWPDDVSPTGLSDDSRRTEFNILSGTSMSCPHLTGVAALLKGAHPEWTPAMIKSAIMTTAYTRDHNGKPLLDSKDDNVSSLWAMGAGHVDPEKAVDPGLVYDLTADDYLDFLCASNYSIKEIRAITRKSVSCSTKKRSPWDLNYPAISVVIDEARLVSLEVTRTVTYVGEAPSSSYNVSVTNPNGVNVTVEPQKMEFSKMGETQSYKVRVSADMKEVPRGSMESEFGQLTWTDGKHQVTSPIVVILLKP
ncbi:Peptidase_S8 domain-containing protein/PA domain-containing protein/Inhibitor_I9 domain-containing protein, partial [Cephalotus follicularis]